MRRRILLAILLAIAVTAAALGVPLGITAWHLVDTIAREDLSARTQQIAASLDNDLANGDDIDLDQVQVAIPADGRLTVFRVDGDGPSVVTRGVDPGTDVITEVGFIARQGRVELTIPAGPMRTRQMQITVAVMLLVLLSIGIGTLVATVTARRLARPLRHVAHRAARLGGGDFRPDASRYGVSELDMVAEALDTSGTALAQIVQRERQLVGDVSHQLRSRLTALQLRLESLTLHPDPEAAEEARAAQEQADRLAEVLDELLAAARAASEIATEPVVLSKLLTEIAQEWTHVLRSEGRTLRVQVGEGLTVRATPGRLREVIGVLLDNAQRHGAGDITASARRGDVEGTVVVEVSDEGGGVPDELVPHVFERGFSGGGSTGVGLALARALAEADGGRLELSGRRPATFSLFLRVPRPGDIAEVRWPAERVPR
jgi:signal transduction histidine kinase